MIDIIEIFNHVIGQTPTYEEAAVEMSHMLADDPEIREAYREWCLEQGYTERSGFKNYLNEYALQQRDIWDTLTDYDE